MYVLQGHDVVPARSMIEGGQFFGNTEGRTVAKTTLIDPTTKESVDVSTMFLCHDHGYWARQEEEEDGEHLPCLFETMVFGGRIHESQRRYALWDEAVAGHEEMVQAVKTTFKGEKPVFAAEVAEGSPLVIRTWHERVLEDDD